ncbi:DUF805 domain-containing protein [Vibrio japonicus]|uniref:DUF805 domain-containing protein n=1 Tax=Vibrio japonicus TaxID=1824638 RepID=A0ABY5LQJ4_9VIBR|nr:DUF805 domain-containing protein [Vibrio japonicus]UUM33037.1 DUF805 domain-containing protein [Vibrio japonicus]
MSFYLLAWQRYLDFTGRASRKEFWMFFLVHFVVTLLFIALDIAWPQFGWADLIYGIVSMLPMVAIIVRRLHDTCRSGWWGWVFVVPAIGPFWLIYLLALDSQEPSQGVSS